ncbi:MAG: hydantoinase/oxoprolinase family protein [Thermoflexibacter sp.]|nr:hydantoinase/oxoprolinase family protein [Thermoflexibacter sp.]
MYKLGIDIGGTFTDLVLLEEKTGKLYFGKTLTTYDDPSNGIINGTKELLARTNISAKQVNTVIHGTTLVTNAVIERRGDRIGLLTTKGFEDVLEIGRELRYDIYDIFLSVPEPLIPRNFRLGISERMNHKGEILAPIDLDEMSKQVQTLVAKGVKSIAVCFLHSFANPLHEQIVGDYIKKNFPHIYFSLSCEVMPEIREYERTSATAMNAYVQPITDHYLLNLRSRLQAIGFDGIIHIMISSGRLTTVDGARQIPIQLLESGPAGGSMAGVFFGKLMDMPDLLTFDMGGTTAKASLIHHSQPEITNQFEAARVRRFKKGSGLPVRIPVIDMIEIGAGGGSIAHIDSLGLLKVGPESAASEPGPACYDRGGKLPTVTDADLVLGYLNENYFLGGTMQLNREKARKAIEEYIANPLGISIEEAAIGIHRIVNENMANAARVHILEKGRDPRGYSMLAFGGAGPVHAFQVARLLNAPQLIIPVGAGVTSALGFLVSPVASEQIRSFVCPLLSMDWDRVNRFLTEMEQEGFLFLERAGIPKSEAIIKRVADMRYTGQGHEITVNIPNDSLSNMSIKEIQQNFKEEYTQRYGRTIDDIGMETVTWRVVISGKAPQIQPQQIVSEQGEKALKGYRKVYLPNEKDAINCPVYARYLLNPHEQLEGPAIIEEMESTTVIGKNSTIIIDKYKNIVINLRY